MLHRLLNLKSGHPFNRMKYFKILIFTLVILSYHNLSFSKEIYFVDLKKILNESKAGKEAQEFLRKSAEKNVNKFKETEESLKNLNLILIEETVEEL